MVTIMNNQNKIKHLEMIQNVINRLSNNSFYIKGWAITIFIAILSLLKISDSAIYAKLCIFSILLFFYLDTYYLFLERRFRELYKETLSKTEEAIDFKMQIQKPKMEFFKTFASFSILPFYLVLLFAAIIMKCILV